MTFKILTLFISSLLLSFPLKAELVSSREDGIAFIVRNMPETDRGRVSLKRIEAEVDRALSLRSKLSWAAEVPWEIYKNDVLPYAVIDEERDTWREELEQIMVPLVKNCTTSKEAVLTITSRIGETAGVIYSVERKKPNQSPKESMTSGLASCSGLSILLVDSLRSVGIPARLAGVLLWSHLEGNHTWVEVWCDGQWEMVEYNEKNFNTPWVIENIGMLNISKKEHRVIASSWRKAETNFPLVWKYARRGKQLISLFPDKLVPGVDVTDRYMSLAKKWYEKNPAPNNTQRLYIDFSKRGFTGRACRKPVEVILRDGEGKELERGMTPTPEHDMRQFLKIFLPHGSLCYLEWKASNGSICRRDVSATDAPVQIVNLEETEEL